MKRTAFGRRIAHGALMVDGRLHVHGLDDDGRPGIVARREHQSGLIGIRPDAVLEARFSGRTVTVTYAVTSIDEQRRRSEAKVEVSNQRGELVAVATHIMKWVPNPVAE